MPSASRSASGAGRNGTSLRSLAYDAIKAEILTGGLAPGSPISEAERAAALGISRTPVREALQSLAVEGLVDVFPKRGTFVARLSARDVRECFELREAIETACARLAAERRTDDDLRQMRIALGDEPPRDGEGEYDRAADFHRVIVQVSQNRYLEQAFEDSASRIDLASRLAARVGPQRSSEANHHAVYEAIARGDGVAAEDAMRRHLRGHAEALLAHLR